MQINDVIEKIVEKPYMMRMGASKVARQLKTTVEIVKEAKKILHKDKLFRDVPANKLDAHTTPKILLLDIETAPLKGYMWRLWKQDIYIDQIISEWFMLSFAGKWLLEPGVFSQRLTGEEALREDDSRIVETLWHLLNEADVVIGHNCEQFDIPRIKTRFLLNDLPPTTYYQQIDTKKVAKSQFGFSSNKLDFLARMFGIDCKMDTEFELWVKCMNGDDEALKYMEIYNRHDVEILEEVYIHLRPFIKAHPNYNLYIDSDVPVCPNCGHNHLEFAGYYYFTQTGKYKNYRCTKCGALARDRKSVLTNRKSILISNGK
jgi:hypothetical protein